MAQEFDLLKSLNIVVPVAATPSRGSTAAPSVDWDARSQSSVASSVLSLRIDKLSEAVVDRMVAHAREASPRHSLELKGAPRLLHKSHNPSSVDGASSVSGVSSVSVPASAAPSIASHWSNKCLVPPPTLKPSHASSSAQSASGKEAQQAHGASTIVLQPSTAAPSKSAPIQMQLSDALIAASSSPSASTSASVAAQASRPPHSVSDAASYSSFRSSAVPSLSAYGAAAPRPYTAHGVSPLSIVVGLGERQPAVLSGRKLQQQKYAQDLAQQIQSRNSVYSPATRKVDAVSTSLQFQPSESQRQAPYPRDRCPFQITKQVRCHCLLQHFTLSISTPCSRSLAPSTVGGFE